MNKSPYLLRSLIHIAWLVCAVVFFLFVKPSEVHAATRTWTGGGSDTKWSTCDNWGGTCPASADTVTFDSTSTKDSVVDADFGGTVSILNINSGYTGTITLESSLTVSSTMTQAAGSFSTSGQPLTITSNYTLSGGTFTGSASDATMSAKFTQTAGTFIAPSQTLYVLGDFAHTGGVFTANNGTVNLYGGRQAISGSTTFNNLTKDSSGPASYSYYTYRLTFTAGTTQTITGSLAFENLEMFSSSDGIQWNIDPQGARNITKVNVQDSNNINSTPITLTAPSVDLGGNTNWVVPTNYGPTIVKDMAHTDANGSYDNFNLRIDGPSAGGHTSYNTMFFADVFGDSNKKDDLVIAVPEASYSHPQVASIYIISDAILNRSEFLGIGKTLDLADSNNYTLRIDGADGDSVGLANFGEIVPTDLDGDEKDDLIMGQQGAKVGTNGVGSVFVIYNSLLRTLQQSSSLTADKNINLDTAGNYNLRINGPANTIITLNGSSTTIKSGFGGPGMKIGNIFNDGGDLIVAAEHATPMAGRAAAGSVYVFARSKISNIQGTGNVYSVDDTTKFTLRIDGYYTKGGLGGYQDNGLIAADLRGTGTDSLVLPSELSVSPGAYIYDLGSGTYTSGSTDLASTHGSMYVISDAILNQFSGTLNGQTLDLADTASYNLQILAPAPPGINYQQFFGMATYSTAADLYNTGHPDIITSAMFMRNDNIQDAGSVYIIPYSVYSSYFSSTGGTISIYDSTSYGLRFDGGYLGDWFGNDAITYTDFFHLGRNDLVVGSPHGKWSDGKGWNPGTVYIIKNAIISGTSGTGNVMDMIDSASSTIVYVGPHDAHLVPNLSMYNTADFDGLLFNTNLGDENGRVDSGSVYVIYNFPHTVTIDSTFRQDSRINVEGTITAPNSVTTIAGVEFQLNTDNPTGNWTGCIATDGAFDSRTEKFLCTTNSANTGDGSHGMYIRAVDTNGSYTAKARYGSFGYSLGISSPTSPTAQILLGVAGNQVVTPVKDSNTNGQAITTIVPSNTLPFTAYLSSYALLPLSTTGTSFEANLKKEGYTLIGYIQNIWYKIDANNHPANGIKILTSSQLKPTLMSLSYKDFNLNGASPETFRLAYSTDGLTWITITSSVVDTNTKTVSAITKIGGYYAIVYGAHTSVSTEKKVVVNESKTTSLNLTKEPALTTNPTDAEQKPRTASFFMAIKLSEKIFLKLLMNSFKLIGLLFVAIITFSGILVSSSLFPLYLSISRSILMFPSDLFKGTYQYTRYYYIVAFSKIFGFKPRRKKGDGESFVSINQKSLGGVFVIFYSQSGNLKTTVTDMYGKYEVALRSDDYKLRAQKLGYDFPSKIITKSSDNHHPFIYQPGTLIKIEEEKTLSHVSIPLDPTGAT